MAYLILVRHGITSWNKEGKWHGLADIPLSEEGRQQARQAAETIKNIKLDLVFTSVLKRNQQTSQEICQKLGYMGLVVVDAALNERDYGIYTGKNKWEVQKQLGDEEFLKLRRSWNQPISKGESLKDVYERVVPFYQREILPELRMGKNVMVVSSGNALRSLIKYLENISDEDIAKLELGFGEVYVFKVDKKGNVLSKEIRASNLYTGKY